VALLGLPDQVHRLLRPQPERAGAPLMPGAEPYRHEGGRTGVLLCHGLTGTPASMRPWGEFLAAHGLTVEAPLLPGHGTTVADCNSTGWPDWYTADEAALFDLAGRCDTVVVGGLSMGGALALHLAQKHPDLVDGVMLVNPALASRDWKFNYLLPVMSLLRVSEYPAVSNDIAKAGVDEVAYDKTPIHAVASVVRKLPDIRTRLPQVTQPTVLFHAPQDRILDDESARLLRRSSGSRDFSYIVLPDSRHVATLDHDAPTIFERSLEFIERVATAAIR
jgi:carboxylesterase